jgi:hypothetical protein
LLWLIAPDEAFIRAGRAAEPKMKATAKLQNGDEQALAAFVAKKAEIDTMLARLQSLSDDHFGWSPDEITWSHVGTLGDYALLLKRITDMAFNEGEHAK